MKPPYGVPSMKELAQRLSEWKRPDAPVVASTFSGAGGSCLGYRMAGFACGYASEFVEAARATYRANFGFDADPRDIRSVKGEEIVAACIARTGRPPDVIEGSPPCAAFSTSGRDAEFWGKVRPYSDGKEQRVDDLFFELIRIVSEVRPKAFTAENVTGLLKGVSRGVFKDIFRRFEAAGYRVSAKEIDAADHGVPQYRRRLFFMGVRDDLPYRTGADGKMYPREPAWPVPLPYKYTVRDALVGITPTPEELEKVSMEGYAVGQEWKKVGRGGVSRRYHNLKRRTLDQPSLTITQRTSDVSAAGVCHPEECRKYTVRELKRICGFPDDFVLTGDYEQQVERLGRAVPPLLMRAVAGALAAVLKG